ITRFGARRLLFPGLGLAVAGLVLFTRAPVNGSYVEHVLPVMVLLGTGMGICFPALMTIAMSGATQEDAGLASGLVNTTAQAGGLPQQRPDRLGNLDRLRTDQRLPPRLLDRRRPDRGRPRRDRAGAQARTAG